MKTSRKVTLSFTIDLEKKEKLSAIANKQGITTSAYVRDIVEKFADKKYLPKNYRKRIERPK